MTLVVVDDKLAVHAAFLESDRELLGFAHGHARVVSAVDHEQRRLNVVSVAQR